jgi:hypothetical protein
MRESASPRSPAKPEKCSAAAALEVRASAWGDRGEIKKCAVLALNQQKTC